MLNALAMCFINSSHLILFNSLVISMKAWIEISNVNLMHEGIVTIRIIIMMAANFGIVFSFLQFQFSEISLSASFLNR